MKMILKYDISNSGGETIAFQTPGAGYFRNVTMKLWTNSTGSTILTFGKFNNDRNFSFTDGTMTMMNAASGPDTYTWRIIDLEHLDNTERVIHKIHFNKRLYVKKDDILKLEVDFHTTSISAFLIIEAEFVFHKNSEFRMTWTFDEITAGGNFEEKMLIPEYLDDAVIEAKGYFNDAAAASSVLLIKHINREHNLDFSDLNTAFRGGINFDMTGPATATRYIIQQPFASSSGGYALVHAQAMFERRITAGDAFAYDLNNMVGTVDSGELDLMVTIVGKVKYKGPSWKTHYFAGNMVMDWNDLVQGGVMV